MGSEADIHRQISDDYGRNIAALLLAVLVSCPVTPSSIAHCVSRTSPSESHALAAHNSDPGTGLCRLVL